MRNYIILNGTNSNTISGLLIQSLAPISKPLMRTETEEIDGRDGDIITPLGFSAYDKEITVGLYGNFDINEVIAFFNSEGTVTFSNEPDKYYNYQIINQIDFDRLVRFRTATVTFHIQPFKFATTGETQTLGGGDPVSDEGTNLVLDGSAEAPFNRLDLKGNATQTTYSGKNLFSGDFAQFDNTGGTGSTYAYFKLPTTDSYTISLIAKQTVTQPAQSKFFGFTASGGQASGGTNWVWNNTSASMTAGQVKSVTVQSGSIWNYISIYPATSATVEWLNENFYIQLEKGTLTSYEPYTNGPAPNPDYPQAIETVTGGQTVSVVGKNLFDKDSTDTVNGYLSSSNGAFVSGGGSYATKNATFLPAGDYVASQMLEKVCHYALDGSYIGLITRTGSSNEKFAMPSNGYVRLQFPSSFNIDTFQLELGSQASDYTPYQGQSYEVNLGKNLLQQLTGQDNNGLTGVTNADGSITVTGTATNTYSFFTTKGVQDIPAGTYTFSDGLDGQTYRCIARFFYADNTYVECDLRNQGAGKSFTLTETATKCELRIANITSGTAYNFTVKPQVELGQATTYAPYFTPIELAAIPNTDYKDKPVKVGDTWYIRRMVGKVDLGTLTWVSEEQFASGQFRATMVGLPEQPLLNGGLLCPIFIWQQGGVTYMSLQDGHMSVTNSQAMPLLRVRNSASYSSMSASDFKTAMNGIVLYYALAEPIDEEITNENLISQLDAIDSEAHAYKGRTHITALAATGNAPHIIAAEVVADASGTITNAGNIYSKPKLTVYGTGNIGIYLNGVQMFQVALGSDGYITIDTNLMEAYKDNLQTLKNRQVTGDYSNFKLPVGANTISFSGSVTQCIVENFSRWL